MKPETKEANRKALERMCKFMWGDDEKNKERVGRLARTLEK